MLGKSVGDLQSNIVVGANAFSGTLKYVADYPGFSSIPAEQSGNYLAFHSESDDADAITVEIGGNGKEITLDSDGIMIIRVEDTSKNVRIRAYKDGVVKNVKTYSLAGLILEEGN